jgi:hypothetical protein
MAKSIIIMVINLLITIDQDYKVFLIRLCIYQHIRTNNHRILLNNDNHTIHRNHLFQINLSKINLVNKKYNRNKFKRD